MTQLPIPPVGQRWLTFENERVTFLAPTDFSVHREKDDTIAVYPAGDSGITLRFSLHQQALHAGAPPDAAERFVVDHASSHGLKLTRLADRVFSTESAEADWPDRRVLVHHWQIGVGQVLVVGTATIWGVNRESKTIRETMDFVPRIIESFRLMSSDISR